MFRPTLRCRRRFPASFQRYKGEVRLVLCSARRSFSRNFSPLRHIELWEKGVASGLQRNLRQFPANTNIQALSAWLKRGPQFDDLAIPCEEEERRRIIEDLDAGKETISFRVAGRLITADFKLREWWAEKVTQQRNKVVKELKPGHDNYLKGIGPVTEYFPSVFGSVPFASFNAAPFISYGLGSQTATFRLETAEKTAAGLNALLNDSRTSLSLGDEYAVFWAVDKTSGKAQPADFLQLLDQPDPLAVRDYLKSVWGSRSPELAQTDFHVAILLKGTGRFSVRS